MIILWACPSGPGCRYNLFICTSTPLSDRIKRIFACIPHAGYNLIAEVPLMFYNIPVTKLSLQLIYLYKMAMLMELPLTKRL
jgi:hypothetical protein